jgi:CheY-like chemotaxis protein/HPt (histidine-containing phosphotransfer) domain-containing protein
MTRILVADDHAINRLLVSRQLKSFGYDVDVVETGQEVLDALARSSYDLILMDCHMPEMNGFDAAREIRRVEPSGRHTPIVALTASVDGRDRDVCLAAGMDDFALKPISHDELLRLLQRWVVDAQRPALDAAKLETLRRTSAGLISDLAKIYLDDAPARLTAIRNAVARNDGPGLAAAAHGLRSGSGNIGAARVAELCGQLEMLGRAGTLDDAPKLLADLEIEYARASRALREL